LALSLSAPYLERFLAQPQDMGLEESYAKATQALQYDRLVLSFPICAVLCSAYIFIEYLLLGAAPAFLSVLPWYLGLVVASAAGYFLVRSDPLGLVEKWPFLSAALTSTLLMIVLGWVSRYSGGFESYFLPPTDVVFIIWGFLYLGGLRKTLLSSLFLFAVFTATVAWASPSLPSLRAAAGHSFVIFLAMCVCLAGGELIERLRRKEFERRWEADRQNEELQAAFEEKKRTQEKLLQIESLATLGEYVAAIMHDLRNPIAGVSSVIAEVISDLKKSGAEAAANQVGDLEFSLQQQKRAEAFVRSLLDLSRKTEGYGDRVDPNAVVRDTLEVLHAQFKRDPVRFSTQLAEGLPPVRGNFAKLGQVLLNLGRNAVEAMGPAGGEIVFETRRAGGLIEILCRDTGPGIPPDVLPRVFDSFFTTKGVGKGTGLGLYLAREIAQRHGGEITAGNAEGGGAVFSIRLPVAE